MRRRTVRAVVASCFLTALVAACAGVPVMYGHFISPIYRVAEYIYAAGGRDFYTVVEGDPFGMGEAEFEEAVLATLNLFEPRPEPTNFTDEFEEAALPLYRTVLVFEAPPAMTWSAICRAAYEGVEPVALERTEGEPVRVAAAYCRGGGALTAVFGEIGGVESVSDPGFLDLLSQVVLLLFPLDEEEDEGCLLAVGGDC